MLNIPKSSIKIRANTGPEGRDFDTVVKGYTVSLIGFEQYNVDIPGAFITLEELDAAIGTLSAQIMEDYNKLGKFVTSVEGKR